MRNGVQSSQLGERPTPFATWRCTPEVRAQRLACLVEQESRVPGIFAWQVGNEYGLSKECGRYIRSLERAGRDLLWEIHAASTFARDPQEGEKEITETNEEEK